VTEGRNFTWQSLGLLDPRYIRSQRIRIDAC